MEIPAVWGWRQHLQQPQQLQQLQQADRERLLMGDSPGSYPVTQFQLRVRRTQYGMSMTPRRLPRRSNSQYSTCMVFIGLHSTLARLSDPRLGHTAAAATPSCVAVPQQFGKETTKDGRMPN